jgi:phosphopantothenoylcysteine synthetase/decarboxylase
MRVLYVIACGAGAAPEVGRLVDQARQRHWDVHVIATPAAVDFLDIGSLEAQTGHAVRSEHRPPGTGSTRSLPRADAIIVAPATYNTINKWALGVSDNYALGILAESVGLGIPTVVLPFVNAALAAHPAFQHSVAVLRDARVAVVLGPDEFEPHPPGTGAEHLDSFPWHRALDQADSLTALKDARSSSPGSPLHAADELTSD